MPGTVLMVGSDVGDGCFADCLARTEVNDMKKMIKRIGAAILCAGLLVSATGCSFSWDDLFNPGNGADSIQVEVPSSYDEEIANKYSTFVLLGVDAREGQLYSGVNSDVIMITSINKETNEVRVASVYRDTIMQMNDGTYNKVNYAQAKWNASETVNVLNRNLDLYISNYVIVNWAAAATTVNLVGGVEVDVTEPMLPYLNGYLTETVNCTEIGSVQLTQAGLQTLDGPQTVAYCRIRSLDSDYQRTERQREVVSQILSKAKAAGPGTTLQIAAIVLANSQTSFSWDDIAAMCSNIGAYSMTESTGFPFEKTSMEYSSLTPEISWPCFANGFATNVTELHQFLYGEDQADYTPSATVMEIDAALTLETE